MRRTEEEAAATRLAVLDAARSVFSQRGYEAAHLEDVAAIAGVTRGAIYHHFGSKADLYVALIDEASGQGGVVIQQAVEEGGTFSEILSRILMSYFALLEDDTRFREVTELALYKAGTSPELEDLECRRSQEARTLVESISEFFKVGIAQGELRKDLDPATGARSLIAFQNGVAMLWLANPEAFSIKGEGPKLMSVFLNGIVDE